ncbi:MAG: hypothetical protein QG599_3861 [Pseudomonadota bacterium]|nr:hypothetical protein [Pseudomonadota bacterium]
MASKEIKTTMRLDEEAHKVVKAACALSGETLSEFIARVGKLELDRLVRERQTQQHDETAFLLCEPNGSILRQRIANVNQGKVIEKELLADED